MKGRSNALQPADSDPQPSDLDTLGDAIAELSAHIQAATYRLLVLIREFDEREGWHAQGARTCAHWLSWRTGLDLGAAREKVRVARALGELPRLSRALAAGEVSYSKVRAITRVATAENEEELLAFAKAGTAAHVERLVRAWRLADRCEELEEAERRRRHRSLETYTDADGMLVVRGRLLPEAGEVLMRALEAARERIWETNGGETGADTTTVRGREGGAGRGGEFRADARGEMAGGRSTQTIGGDGVDAEEATYSQQLADALVLVAESALGGGLSAASERSSAERYQVVVHVDEPVLKEKSASGQAALENGVRVSAETSRRLACDASKVVMRHGHDGSVLDVGRRTRAVSPALRRALGFRDRGCRFPGCGVKICDAHHVEHWADGGRTSLDNLLLLCRRHHTAVHEEGFRVLMRADGSAKFYSPRGRPIPEVPVQPRLPGDPMETLEREHRELGVRIDAETGLAGWRGEPFDLALALDGLRRSTGVAELERAMWPDVSAETSPG